jgi:hypothetical protein
LREERLEEETLQSRRTAERSAEKQRREKKKKDENFFSFEKGSTRMSLFPRIEVASFYLKEGEEEKLGLLPQVVVGS